MGNYTLKVERKISEENIHYLMTTAFESCNSWLYNYQPEAARTKDNLVKEILIHEPKGNEEEGDAPMRLGCSVNQTAFMVALQAILNEDVSTFGGYLDDVLDGSGDANQCDLILQYAMFGEEVYC